MEEKKRKLLQEFVDNECEMCHKEFEYLSPHRIRRAYQGGTYEFRNIKMICSECHKLIHGNEMDNVRSK